VAIRICGLKALIDFHVDANVIWQEKQEPGYEECTLHHRKQISRAGSNAEVKEEYNQTKTAKTQSTNRRKKTGDDRIRAVVKYRLLSASLSVSGSEQKVLSPSTPLSAIQKLLERAIAIRSLHCSLSGAGIFVILNEHPCSYLAVIGSSLRRFDKRATGIA
jgi:hypothetical protein